MLAYPPFIFFHLYYSRPLFSFFAYATLYRNTIILYLTKKLRDSRTLGVRDSVTLGPFLFNTFVYDLFLVKIQSFSMISKISTL